LSDHLLDRPAYLHDSAPMLHRIGFDAWEQVAEQTIVVRLRGELDLATAPELSRVLDDALGRHRCAVTLDLTELTFLDSAGILLLVNAHHRAEAQGCLMILRAPCRSVLKALRLTGVDRLLLMELSPQIS